MKLSLQRQDADQSSNSPKRQKYFVNRRETVTIRCRTCGRVDTYSVAQFKGKEHSMQVHCPCTQIFDVDLEFRQDFRQKTNIAASYRALTTPRSRARPCVIADQSNGGLLLAISDDVPVAQDDRLIVSYFPDVDARHEIERVVRVRHHERGSRIGGAFIDDSAAHVRPTAGHTTILH